MNQFNRRIFLGGAAAGLIGSRTLPGVQVARIPSGAAATGKKLVTIFLRGGADGVSTVVPVMDPGIDTARGALFNQLDTVPLTGTSFAALNSDYSELLEIDAEGNAAWIHQVGNPEGQRSHFDEMDVYETAMLHPDAVGFLARLRGEMANPTPLWGASCSQAFQRMFRSADPSEAIAHVQSIAAHRLSTGTPVSNVNRFRMLEAMADMSASLPPAGSLLGDYQANLNFTRQCEAALPADPNSWDANRFPRTLAQANTADLDLPITSEELYRPIGSFMQSGEEAVHILQNAPGCNVVGIELGGWDTHTDQVDRRITLDRALARMIRSIYELTEADKTTILVLSEFGRTNRANTGAGTDHGIGGLMMLFGQRVRGGVYNCHGGPTRNSTGAPWESLQTGAFNEDNAQNVATDFRLIYHEILTKLFGLDATALGNVVPGWGTIPNPTQNISLNVLS